MPTAGLELGGEETSSAADPPFCRQQERWDSNPQSNLCGSKRREGARAECCRQQWEPGDREQRRLLGRRWHGPWATSSEGQEGRRGCTWHRAERHAGPAGTTGNPIPPGAAMPAIETLQSAKLSDASCRCGSACFYTQDSVYHLGLPLCPMPVSLSKAFG